MTQRARPITTNANSGWTVTSDFSTDLADESDSTTISSSGTATGSSLLGPLIDPVSSVGHVVHIRRALSTSGTSGTTMNLYQGAPGGGGSVIASRTLVENDLVGNDILLLSGAEADAITDYEDLYVEFAKTGSHFAGIYEAWLDVPGGAQVARPSSTTTAWGGTVVGPSEWEALSDDSDATLLTGSSGTPTSGRIETLVDPVSSVEHTLRIRVDRSSGTGVPTIALYQGDPAGAGTLIFSASVSVTTDVTDQTYTLSGGEADSITDYDDLYWSWTKSGGTATAILYEYYFDVPEAPEPDPPFVWPSAPSHRQYEPPEIVSGSGRGARSRGRRY